MDALNDLNKLVEQVGQTASKAFNQAITPEVMQHLNAEQKELVNQGRNAFKLNGLTLDEKMAELHKTLDHVAKYNK